MHRHPAVLDRLVAALRAVPTVIAIGAYGSTATRAWTEFSDIDLVAVVGGVPAVESLRFFVDGIAVDLNFRAADASDRGIGGADFMPDVTPLWDPTSVLQAARPTGRTHNPDATPVMRYMLHHNIQKIRQIDGVTERRVASSGVADQILNAWFQARGEPYPGVIAAVAQIRGRDPRLLELLDQALRHEDHAGALDVLAEAAEHAASPAGGMFRPGDVFALSWERPKVEVPPEEFAAVVAVAD